MIAGAEFKGDRVSSRDQNSRAVFLALVSRLLNTALDYESILESFAELTVPALADWCIIDVFEKLGGRESRFHHQDSRLELRHDLGCLKFPDELRLKHENGESAHCRLDTDALLPSSCMIAPLVARGEVIGAITFGLIGNCASFCDDDLALAEELGRLVGLAAHNAKLVKDLKYSNEARAELIAVVSHELKTPITSIKLNSDLLQRYLTQKDLPKQSLIARLKSMYLSTIQLERITSDLLDCEKIEIGKLSLSLERADVNDILSEIQNIFLPIALEKKLHFQVDCEQLIPSLTCDRGRIIQVLSNLISNSIKFTPSGGQVACQARLENNSQEVRFEVVDTGSGIHPDQLDKVFERYWQASQSAFKGSGLGLYIAMGIVEAHNGKIDVRSKLGEGSIFYFNLPLSQGH